MYTLITGASSGIGKALAIECAVRGMNLLLIALAGAELDDLTEQIQSKYKIKCNCLGINLSAKCSSHTVYEWVKQNNYQVNILINNVGVGSKGEFENISTDFYAAQINLNI